jgi:hypothetical protein
VSSALPDDAVDSRQPQACPPALRLRGEERLEDARARGFVHAAARVTHDKRDVAARLHVRAQRGRRSIEVRVRGLDGESSSSGHRIPGVNDEINENLLELALV